MVNKSTDEIEVKTGSHFKFNCLASPLIVYSFIQYERDERENYFCISLLRSCSNKLQSHNTSSLSHNNNKC